MRRLSPILLILLCGTPLSAQAQDGAGCAKFKWSIARERTAFGLPGLPVVASGEALPGVLAASKLKLQPQSAVVFVHPPGRKPKADPAYAALTSIPPIAVTGTYQVTLSEEAWIDVFQEGKEVRSSGFSGQPDCPGVRKSVKFALLPGPATIQISGVSTDSVNIEVLPIE